MANAQPLGQIAHGWGGIAGKPFDGQQRLVLLRGKTRLAGSTLAEGEKIAQQITKLCEFPIIFFSQSLSLRTRHLLSY
jgi:hypothetical protein